MIWPFALLSSLKPKPEAVELAWEHGALQAVSLRFAVSDEDDAGHRASVVRRGECARLETTRSSGLSRTALQCKS